MTDETNQIIAVTGFNAHSQISTKTSNDIFTFTTDHGLRNAQILFAGWSTTVCVTEQNITSFGHQTLSHDFATHGLGGETLHNAFGDHNGMMGCLSTTGKLILVEPPPFKTVPSPQSQRNSHSNSFQPSHLILASTAAQPLISHLALAGNGKLALTCKQAPDSPVSRVLQFATFTAFLAWYSDPSVEANRPEKVFTIPGRAASLATTAVNFVLLMESGEVVTWGDARFGTLARRIAVGGGCGSGDGDTSGDTSGDEKVPAEEPGVVEAVGGLHIVRIECGSWISGALSRDGALYLWGSRVPGAETRIGCLKGIGVGEVALVEVEDGEGEPIDVVDFGIGDMHVAVVSSERRLYVVGSNGNGQLGLDQSSKSVEDWVECRNVGIVQRVVCSPGATFIYRY